MIKAADEFRDKTTAPNQLWQTDFTYLKVIGWGWFYLSTILDDYSRYIITWKLCTTMKADDVTDTLNLALKASGCDSAKVIHKPRLLSDNGSSYISGDLAEWLDDHGMDHVARFVDFAAVFWDHRQERFFTPGGIILGSDNGWDFPHTCW